MRKNDETMKVIYYSWEESIQDLHELVRQMSIDRFRPQVIVGISRGGLPPAVMLSAYYDIPLKRKLAAFSSMGGIHALSHRSGHSNR